MFVTSGPSVVRVEEEIVCVLLITRFPAVVHCQFEENSSLLADIAFVYLVQLRIGRTLKMNLRWGQ